MHCKTVTILLRIRVRGHFVMSITKNHEWHYVTVLDNPLYTPISAMSTALMRPRRPKQDCLQLVLLIHSFTRVRLIIYDSSFQMTVEDNCDWLERLASGIQPMRIKTKTNRTIYPWFFPRFELVTGNCEELWLIHRAACSCCDWSE